MMAPDLWHRVWQLVLTYPGMAIMLVLRWGSFGS